MSDFDNLDKLRILVLGILDQAPDSLTAMRWIRALPGPSTVRGGIGGPVTDELPAAYRRIHFEILGEITVRFNDDGTREATFTIAAQYDDSSMQSITVYWAQGFLTAEQSRLASIALFGSPS